MYGHAGWLREQICNYMCPYARIQSTLIDGDSLVIAYDGARGDPRGARPRRADPASVGLGLHRLHAVRAGLPTGIDIRNGLQNECIGCAACIDACDDVMRKMDYPTGLIRYATQRRGAGPGTAREMLRRVLRPRVLIYGALLSAAGTAFVVGLAMRSPVGMDVIRDRGVMARLGEDGRVQNLYRDAADEPHRAHDALRAGRRGPAGLVVDGSRVFEVPPGEVHWPFTLRLRCRGRSGAGSRRGRSR